jgi:hypothetical protein
MPFKSKSQRRKFYSTPELRRYIPEFEKGTPKRLPEKIKKNIKKNKNKK